MQTCHGVDVCHVGHSLHVRKDTRGDHEGQQVHRHQQGRAHTEGNQQTWGNFTTVLRLFRGAVVGELDLYHGHLVKHHEENLLQWYDKQLIYIILQHWIWYNSSPYFNLSSLTNECLQSIPTELFWAVNVNAAQHLQNSNNHCCHDTSHWTIYFAAKF